MWAETTQGVNVATVVVEEVFQLQHKGKVLLVDAAKLVGLHRLRVVHTDHTAIEAGLDIFCVLLCGTTVSNHILLTLGLSPQLAEKLVCKIMQVHHGCDWWQRHGVAGHLRELEEVVWPHLWALPFDISDFFQRQTSLIGNKSADSALSRQVDFPKL